jgi:hypothetical protein
MRDNRLPDRRCGGVPIALLTCWRCTVGKHLFSDSAMVVTETRKLTHPGDYVRADPADLGALEPVRSV